MENTEIDRSVLIVTGMHRSGTSLATSLLQSSGVVIGDRLMGGTTGNTKGHFEDLDFVDFHRDALIAQAANREGWTTRTDFAFSPEYLARAKALIATRNQYLIWGWKDPRTTLFLDCWSRLLVRGKFVFIYRSPWDVVDSLFRRGDEIFKTNPEIAIQTWLSYNQAILRFCHQSDRPWILLRIEDVIQSSQFAIDSINYQFDLNLRSPQKLYDRSLFQVNAVNLHQPELIQRYFPQAFELYLQLHQQATLLEEVQITKIEHSSSPWFWQNWLDRPLARVRTTRGWFKLKRSANNQ